MTRMSMILAWVSFGLLAVAGCFKADVTVPEIPYYGSSGSVPPANITRADPNDRCDLLRENQQLRDRIAWLEQDNSRLERKIRSLREDQAEIQADIDKAAAQRDRYKQALER